MSTCLAALVLHLPVLAGPPAPPLSGKPWLDMDYGPYLTASIEVPGALKEGPRNIAYKGLAIRVGGDTRNAAGGERSATVLFDTDLLRCAAGWTGGFLRMTSVVWDGSHETHPSIAGRAVFVNRPGPGWAGPGQGAVGAGGFRDPRALPYGPLPREWAHYQGLYLHGEKVILSYSVGKTRVLEMPGLEERPGLPAFTRALNVGGAEAALALQVCEQVGKAALVSRTTLEPVAEAAAGAEELVLLGEGGSLAAAGCAGLPAGARWSLEEGAVRLRLPPSPGLRRLVLVVVSGGRPLELPAFRSLLASIDPPDLEPLTHGGPARWPEKLHGRGSLGPDGEPYTIDSLSAPPENPWRSWMRFGGFDFFPDSDRAAICTWSGDVWTVEGLTGRLEDLVWRRIAAGLFQPLGLKVVEGKVYVLGRDQITLLEDLNGDGETDFYRSFNNDHQVTEHFHEFAMDLQTDQAGNFYYTKAGRHARQAVVPQHGTLLRVSRDGSRTDILANGFRAPNGLCVEGDGAFIVSDQEGHWTPANRINRVEPGTFHGYQWSYQAGEKAKGYQPPLVWIHPQYDRSPAEQLRVAGDRWGLAGQLISLSYGMGSISLVMTEAVEGRVQGGVTLLPLKLFPTGILRGRFHPTDGQLYVCGLFGWSSNRTLPGGFYRVRFTGKPLRMPVELHATTSGLWLRWSDPLDRAKASAADRFAIERWNYKWREEYGSPDLRLSDGQVGRDRVEVKKAEVRDGGLWVHLEIPDMRPCMQMRLRWRIASADGTPLSGELYNTIHALGTDEPWPRPSR